MQNLAHCWRARWLLPVALGVAGVVPSAAEVVDAAPAGFHLKVERSVTASPAQAYADFLAVAKWWDGEHSWFGEAANFKLEPKAGGCLCEISGERQVLHMTVSFVDPGRELRMLGGLGPLQTLGLGGTLSFRFDARADGGSNIVHEYRVTGYLKDGLDSLAPIVDAVQTQQVERLVAWIERER